MKRKYATILALCSAVIIYGSYYFGLPYFLNKPLVECMIEEKTFEQTGYKISLVNPKYKAGFLPSIKLRADNFYVLNDDGSKALAIAAPKVKLKLFPLIFKKIEVSEFSAQDLDVNLVFDKNSTFRLGQYPIVKKENSELTLNRLKVDLKKYDINLHDETQNKDILLQGENFKIDNFKNNKHIKFSTNSHLFVGDKAAKIQANADMQLPLNKISEDKALFDLNIENVDLADFTVYAKSLSKGKIKELRGVINVNSKTQNVHGHRNIVGVMNIDKLGIMQKDKASSIYCDDVLKVETNFNVINNGLKINNLKVLSKNIDFFLNGTIHKTNEKFPTLDLKTTINQVSGKELLALFPGDENLNPDFNFYKLKQHVIYGNAIGNIDIKGKADYPNLYGNVLLNDVYLIEPIKDAPKNGVLKIKLNGHQMNLKAHVLTAPSQYVDVNGTFKLFRNRYTDMYIKTTDKIEFTKAVKVVMPLHDIFKFELGPIPMMNITGGTGNANLHISGSKAEPHASGYIKFKNGVASFITINNMVVKNISGQVDFNDENVKFKTSSAYLNNLPVDIEGNCNLKGDLTVDVRGNNQNSKDLFKIINTSPILAELQEMLSPIKSASGKTKVFLNIFGHVTRGVEPVFNKDLFAKGSVEFVDNNMTFFDYHIPASKISGLINFDRDDGDFNLKANLINSPIEMNGVIKNEIVTANALSHKFNAADAVKVANMVYGNKIPQIKGLNTISTSFSGHYQGPMDINSLDYNKIVVKGKIYNNYGSKSPILVNNSDFEIKNGHLKTSVIRGAIKKNPYNLQLDVNNAFDDKRLVSGSFSMRDFDLAVLNDLDIISVPALKDFAHFQGKINIASRIKNNNIRLFSRIGDTSVIYKPKRLKLKVLNGNILLDKNDLSLNKINAYAGVMPVFINGKINNINTTKDLNLYLNAKPSQEFFDQFFNSKSVYPIKLKGDVLFSSNLKGPVNRLNSKTELKLDESSSLYYMGATIGDLTNPVRIYIDSITSPTSVKLNNFVYEKIITSQNNKQFPSVQLTAGGAIDMVGKNVLKFHNFRVKTENPTDAKIFNILFKKPFMKQGVFTSNLLINGDTINPRILGKLDVKSIDLPVVDTTVKDISLDFKNDNIYVKTKSSVLSNSILLDAVLKNKLTPPYIFNDVKLYFEDLDLNRISSAIRDYESDLYKQQLGLVSNTNTITPDQIIIKRGEILADNIKIKELKATDFKSDISIDKNRIAKADNFNFKVADGNVYGDLVYDILKEKLNINAHIHDSNVQIISESLFNMKGQFFGNVNGDMALSCTGNIQDNCVKTLSGNGQFVINDGRMPKLGSLEYLLKATNLVTGGITGVSINGIIDLITPLKTGEFKSITGHYDIEDGIVKNLEVFSKGKDLNLYLSGTYNIENYNADMDVYGSISSNITSVFGKLKNFSLNTLLNTIPLLNKGEISEDVASKIEKIPSSEHSNISRIFAAEIEGDINGLNYVKSFKWVK